MNAAHPQSSCPLGCSQATQLCPDGMIPSHFNDNGSVCPCSKLMPSDLPDEMQKAIVLFQWAQVQERKLAEQAAKKEERKKRVVSKPALSAKARTAALLAWQAIGDRESPSERERLAQFSGR